MRSGRTRCAGFIKRASAPRNTKQCSSSAMTPWTHARPSYPSKIRVSGSIDYPVSTRRVRTPNRRPECSQNGPELFTNLALKALVSPVPRRIRCGHAKLRPRIGEGRRVRMRGISPTSFARAPPRALTLTEIAGPGEWSGASGTQKAGIPRDCDCWEKFQLTMTHLQFSEYAAGRLANCEGPCTIFCLPLHQRLEQRNPSLPLKASQTTNSDYSRAQSVTTSYKMSKGTVCLACVCPSCLPQA